ncbi:hypothetical protein ACQW02_10230 [Humitalea sp. 24SJ18S-53]
MLYVAIGALCVLVIGGGYALYQERQKPALEISIGGHGVTVQGR